jgi:hypothetical protein
MAKKSNFTMNVYAPCKTLGNRYSVVLEYGPVLDSELDKGIEKVAKKHKGSFSGSGFCFFPPTRDLQFEFKTKKTATAFFVDAGKRIKSIK